LLAAAVTIGSMTVPIFAEGEKIRIAVIHLSCNTFLFYIEIGTLKRQAITGKPACFGQAVSSGSKQYDGSDLCRS
jgi:hypothetical protein